MSRSVQRRIAAQEGKPAPSFANEDGAAVHWVLDDVRCKHCGKVIYKTEGDAEYAARAMIPDQVPYPCPYRSVWHLTTKKKA
jgi:hypothetical protein